MEMLEDFSATLLSASKAIAAPVLSLPVWWVFMAGLIPMVLWLVGRRLSTVVKPERPYVSPVVRFFGSLSKWAGLIAIACELAGFAALLIMLFLYQVLSDVGVKEAIWKAWLVVYEAGDGHVLRWLQGCLLGLVIALPISLYIIPRWERGDGLDDVEELVKRFKKLNSYDPRPYIKLEKGCFVGKDQKGRAIYIPWPKLRETHVQVLGTTGGGKGVVMSLVAYQCVLAGETTIWFDPKYDRYSPRILEAAAKRAGRPFCLVNINPSSGPQINPLAGADDFAIEDLFVAAFDLRSKGTDGDFHRGKDEDAAAEAARLAVETGELSIPGLFKACATVASITEQENFWRKFKKLARLPAVNTKGGLNLSEAIANGAVIYIIGSADNERVKMLQKLILVRVMQIIKSRDRLAKAAPICVVLDEFKHMLSPSAFTDLGVIRDFDTHFILAHQSIGDLHSCSGIDPAEAHGAVVDNTAIKIVYKIGDDEYAEKMSRVSGKRRTYVENSSKKPDENGVAVGSWREDEVQHIDMDLLTHLPMPSDRTGQASVGVLFGVGNAKLFHVGPVPVPESCEMPIPVVAEPYTTSGNAVTELI